MIRPFAGSRKIPTIVQTAFDQQRCKIRQPLVFGSLFGTVGPLCFANSRWKSRSAFFGQRTVPKSFAVEDRLVRLQLREHEFALIVAENHADIGTHFFPDPCNLRDCSLTRGIVACP